MRVKAPDCEVCGRKLVQLYVRRFDRYIKVSYFCKWCNDIRVGRAPLKKPKKKEFSIEVVPIKAPAFSLANPPQVPEKHKPMTHA